MLRLLVIDDDVAHSNRIVRRLSGAGYEVHSAINGSHGLRMLIKKQFDLLITEIVMPEKDGLETISEIRRKGVSIPIIAMSGGGRIGPSYYLKMAQVFGADRMLLKPICIEILLPIIHELVGKDER